MNIRTKKSPSVGARIVMAGVTATAVLLSTAGSATGAAAQPTAARAGAPDRSAVYQQEPIRETVYVTSEMDSDGDGRADRIAVALIRPAETAQGTRVASIVHASPYFGQAVTTLVDPHPNLDPGVPPLPAPHFAAWYEDHFVPRGYAVVEVEMQGTADSDGCATSGGPEDTLSAKAAVDWLNGRASASYADGTPAVATWSTGAVGMIGLSYAGALPVALAETGIDGLRAIVPVDAVTNWYEYARADGIAYGGFTGGYPRSLALRVSHDTAKTECADRYERLGTDADDATADLNAFWAARDYRNDADRIQAAVLLVHGQQDDNTKMTMAGRYWDVLAREGVPRKLWLHDGRHVDPFNGNAAGREMVGRFMDHWLYGEANGIMDEPMATVQRPNGNLDTYPTWPGPGAVDTSFHVGGPGQDAAGTLLDQPGPAGTQSFVDNRGLLEEQILRNPGTAHANRLVYLGPTLAGPRRLSGAGRVEVAFRVTATSTPLTALLVHYTDGVVTRVVARGALDTKNRTSLTTPTPLVPGERYTATVRLEPKDYVFPAGGRIGLVLVANHNTFVATDEIGKGATVTVDFTGSRLILPMVD